MRNVNRGLNRFWRQAVGAPVARSGATSPVHTTCAQNLPVQLLDFEDTNIHGASLNSVRHINPRATDYSDMVSITTIERAQWVWLCAHVDAQGHVMRRVPHNGPGHHVTLATQRPLALRDATQRIHCETGLGQIHNVRQRLHQKENVTHSHRTTAAHFKIEISQLVS